LTAGLGQGYFPALSSRAPGGHPARRAAVVALTATISGCAAVGPNYNFPWELQDPGGKATALARAYDSTREALALTGRVSAPERALIEALPARYPRRDPIDDQRPWNDAFADAMRFAHKAHSDDLDLRSIFAEAILNRTPWRMWDLRTGEPAAGAEP